MAKPFKAGLMTASPLSTTNRATKRVMVEAMKSSQKESQRVPQKNSKKWLELMSFSDLNLQHDKGQARV